MYKKRGVLIVVLVLLVLGSLSAISAEDSLTTYRMITAPIIDDDCEDDEFLDPTVPMYQYCLDLESCKYDDCDGEDEPYTDEFPDTAIPSQPGCFINVIEDDIGKFNVYDCGWAVAPIGFNLDDQPHPLGPTEIGGVIESSIHQEDTDITCLLNDLEPTYKNGNGVLCASNRYWYQCDTNHIGSMIWAGDELFKCSLVNEDDPFFGFVWESQGDDRDKDGYAVDEDCFDNPVNDPASCPQIKGQDEVDLYGLSQNDLRTKIRSSCTFPQDASCAICQNPGAPEVCGDFDISGEPIDNDCKPETSNDCDKYQAACTQEPVPDPGAQLTGTCSESGETCDPTEEEPCGEEGGSCDPDEDQQLGYSAQAFNIYDESFSWIETKEEEVGYCCGFHGIDDLGKTRFEANNEGHFVCLNSNEDLVGRDSDIEGVFPDDGGIRCGDNWCWVNSVGQSQAFKILTIKKPDDKPFDVVSNNDEWIKCKEGTGPFEKLPVPQGSSDFETQAEPREKSNRFYCYEEGDHWSLAECTDERDQRQEQGAKGRFEGEGLFVLPMREGTESAVIKEERIDKPVTVFSEFFDDFYGDGHFLDFTGYTHLNFMVRFVDSLEEGAEPIDLKDINLPVAINLTIKGPRDDNNKDIIYYSANVLGDVVNSPLFDADNYMHIKVPIGEYKAVTSISIESYPAQNYLAVRNIYLSNSAEPSLCSGQDSESESSWLTNIDQADPDKEITGQKLCSNLYGDSAWLGDDEVVGDPSASCCGNVQQEYYAGPSQEVVDLPQEGEEEPVVPEDSEKFKYGCWNSQAIASGDTIMDVQFEVDYWKKEFSVEYESLQVPAVSEVNFRTLMPDAEEPYESDDYAFSSVYCKNEPTNLVVGDTYEELCQFKISDVTFQVFEEGEGLDSENLPLTLGETEAWFKDISSEKIEVNFYDMVAQEQAGTEILEKGGVDDELYISQTSQYLSEEESEFRWNHPIAVIARLKEKEYFPATPSPPEDVEVTGKTKTFSCSEDECLFPLPGNPPYKITNPFPHLYELFFVTGSETEDETLITQPKQEFNAYGNIKARKIAQQILYYNEGEDAVPATGFYACNAAQFIQDTLDDLPYDFTNYFNQPYCSVVGDKFCSYSVEIEDAQEKFTTVNSWSDDDIEYVGYDDVPESGEQNTSLFYSQIELQLKDAVPAFSAEERNHSTSVLPARNFIPNAEFRTSALKIPHWDITDNNGVFVDDPKTFVDDGVITLPAGHKLRSERIAVTSGTTLHFSQENQCQSEVTLVDKDGNPTGSPGNVLQISTGEASYLLLEFTGPCQVEKPMLQLLDEDGAAEYYYKSQPGLDNFDARSGAACCPQDYCWNGYACVEPMTELTSLSEHVEDGRDYRCIGGQWTKSSVKYDWNAQRWGFCKQESECFVLSSEFAEDGNTAESFYDGEYPICIGNSEYIFDHLCDEGSWTSRTKFLATKMMEVAENDDYVLYCSPYRETLLDYQDSESYLGGDLSQVQQSQQGLGDVISNQPEQEILRTCFTTILDPQGKRLVQDEENTCINNACVLRYKEGGRFKTALATTLNKPLDDPKSFLLSLNVPQNQLGELCVGQQGEFVECDLSEINLPSTANLWYSEDLDAVIYAREGLQLDPRIIDKILNWFADLFGVDSKLSEENKFVDEAQNFKDLYVLKNDDKQVRAVKEIFPGVKQTLVAEYENFETPVCEYVYNINVPPELQTELLEEVSDISKLTCSVNGSKQRVEMVEGLDFFWPQLTGKLRVS